MPKIIKSKDYGMDFTVINHPYNDLEVPESWANVNEFAEWWMSMKMPIRFPAKAEVFVSDDAAAVTLFRQGRFQVELYLIHPQPKVPVHEHPDVEVIKMNLSSVVDGETNQILPIMSETLTNGKSHGAGMRVEAEKLGYPLFAFQHWLTRDPTTVAAMWKGETVGPRQEALIKRFNPDAYVVDGYADITQKINQDHQK